MVLLLPILFYVILIFWIVYQWNKNREYEITPSLHQPKVSILIPFKNEEDNLSVLTQSLQLQSYSSDLVECIFINDDSDDNSERLLNDYTVIQSEGKGKKSALKTGLAVAKGELIITLDADCVPQEQWLESIVSFYEKEKSDLIICPVNIAPVNTFWAKVQALEFQSLAACTGGAALGGLPIMCNGANLAFKKTLVETEEDFFNQKYNSGDDMFLLEFAKAKKKKISYLKSQEALVSTFPVSWNGFWSQRARWTSKAGAYSDAGIISVGVVVLLANLSLFILPSISGFYLLIAFAMKMFVDFLLLNISSSFFKTSDILWLYFLILPFYPFYVVYSLLMGLFSKTK